MVVWNADQDVIQEDSAPHERENKTESNVSKVPMSEVTQQKHMQNDMYKKIGWDGWCVARLMKICELLVRCVTLLLR